MPYAVAIMLFRQRAMAVMPRWRHYDAPLTPLQLPLLLLIDAAPCLIFSPLPPRSFRQRFSCRHAADAATLLRHDACCQLLPRRHYAPMPTISAMFTAYITLITWLWLMLCHIVTGALRAITLRRYCATEDTPQSE